MPRLYHRNVTSLHGELRLSGSVFLLFFLTLPKDIWSPLGFCPSNACPINVLLSDGGRVRRYSLPGEPTVPPAPPRLKKGGKSAGGFVAAARSRRLYGGEKWGPVPIFRPRCAPAFRHAAILGRPHRRLVLSVRGVELGWGWGGGNVLKTCQVGAEIRLFHN
jgi:hypothetical protein